MSTQYASEGFMSTPLEGSGARPKDDYHPDSEDNEVRFREADEEYQRLKADFARFAQAKRMTSHSRSDSSRSSSPLGRQSQRDVLRTYQSSESPLSTPRMLNSGSTKLRLSSLFTRSTMMMRGTAQPALHFRARSHRT